MRGIGFQPVRITQLQVTILRRFLIRQAGSLSHDEINSPPGQMVTDSAGPGIPSKR